MAAVRLGRLRKRMDGDHAARRSALVLKTSLQVRDSVLDLDLNRLRATFASDDTPPRTERTSRQPNALRRRTAESAATGRPGPNQERPTGGTIAASPNGTTSAAARAGSRSDPERDRPAVALCGLAQPQRVDLRPGADLRRARELIRVLGDPHFWRALVNTVAGRRRRRPCRDCCSACGMALLFAAGCRSGAAARRVLAPYAVSEVIGGGDVALSCSTPMSGR